MPSRKSNNVFKVLYRDLKMKNIFNKFEFFVEIIKYVY